MQINLRNQCGKRGAQPRPEEGEIVSEQVTLGVRLQRFLEAFTKTLSSALLFGPEQAVRLLPPSDQFVPKQAVIGDPSLVNEAGFLVRENHDIVVYRVGEPDFWLGSRGSENQVLRRTGNSVRHPDDAKGGVTGDRDRFLNLVTVATKHCVDAPAEPLLLFVAARAGIERRFDGQDETLPRARERA